AIHPLSDYLHNRLPTRDVERLLDEHPILAEEKPEPLPTAFADDSTWDSASILSTAPSTSSTLFSSASRAESTTAASASRSGAVSGRLAIRGSAAAVIGSAPFHVVGDGPGPGAISTSIATHRCKRRRRGCLARQPCPRPIERASGFGSRYHMEPAVGRLAHGGP